MGKYFGDFSSREDVVRAFEVDDAVAPSEDSLLFAAYGLEEDYEGYAIVIFYGKDGALYEVNGSHCSCMGLEGQWEPEQTTWEALVIREIKCGYAPDAIGAFRAFVTARANVTGGVA